MINVDVIRNNFQLLCIMALWFIVGAYMGPLYLGFITIFIFLLFLNGRTADVFLGFLFILIMSDNLENATNFAKTYKTIYVMILFAFLLVELRDSEFVFVKSYQVFIPYFIFGVIGLLYSPIVGTSLQKLLSYVLLYIAVPNYVVNCYRLYGVDFFRSLMYLLLVVVFFGVITKYIWPEVAISHGGRLRGWFGNPNGLGIFLILMYVLFSILNNMYKDFTTRGEKIMFFLIMFYAVIASGSRTALMAILAFHIFTYIFAKSKFLGFLLFFLVALLIEAFIVYFPRIIVALDLQESFRVETLQEGSGRTIAWAFAWENIKQSILIGKGFAFDEHLMRSNFEFLSKLGHQGGVHNTYLIMWLNTGIFGLVCFLRGFFLLFIRASKRTPYAFPIMFAVMLSINFEPWLAASLNPFTILFLVVITVMTEDIFYKDIAAEDAEIEENIQVA